MKMTKFLHSLLRCEKKLIERSTNVLWYRRLNWRLITNHTVHQAFELFANEAKAQDYPIRFCVQQYQKGSEGTIQLTAQALTTGAVDRHEDLLTGKYTDSPILESGSSLVVSQGVFGQVLFIIHPYRSERVSPNYKEILLFKPLEPLQVNIKLVQKALELYMLSIRSSSVIGQYDTMSYLDRFKLIWLRFNDIRNRTKTNRSLIKMQNEWAKIIVTAFFAAIITYLNTK